MLQYYPYEETHDLRSGPDLDDSLLGLLPFVGFWRGTGKGGFPAEAEYEFAQEVVISHDGRPFLHYESRAWVIDDEGRPVRPAFREVGWWRPGPDDGVEVLLTHPSGVSEIYVGRIDGLKLELGSDVVMRTETAEEVSASRRLYGVVEGALLYAVDVAAQGQPMQSHVSARLARVNPDAAA
ncbi:MAG: FABP family protein [Mycobacteriales bacterium]